MLICIVYSFIRSYAQLSVFRSSCCCDCQCSWVIGYAIVTLCSISYCQNLISSYILSCLSIQFIIYSIASKCSFYCCCKFRISSTICLIIAICCYSYRLRCDLHCSFQFYQARIIVCICYSDFDCCFCYIFVLIQIGCPSLSTIIAVFYNISIQYIINCDRMLVCIVYSFIRSYAQLFVFRSGCCCNCQCSRIIGYAVVTLCCVSYCKNLISSYVLSCFSIQYIVYSISSKCSFYFCCKCRISSTICLIIAICCYSYRLRCDLHCSFQFYQARIIVCICYSDFDCCFCYIFVLIQIGCPSLSTIIAVFYNISIQYIINCDRMLICIVYSFIRSYAQLSVFRSGCCCDCQCSRMISYIVVTLYSISTCCNWICAYTFPCLSAQVIRYFISSKCSDYCYCKFRIRSTVCLVVAVCCYSYRLRCDCQLFCSCQLTSILLTCCTNLYCFTITYVCCCDL